MHPLIMILGTTLTRIGKSLIIIMSIILGTGNYDKKQGTGLSNAQLTDNYFRWTNMLTNVRTTYDKTFLNNHHIVAMVGWEQSYIKTLRPAPQGGIS